MLRVILAITFMLFVTGCGKKADAAVSPSNPAPVSDHHDHVCKCESKLVASKVAWFNGMLCPPKDAAGAIYKSQGTGRNAQGYQVVACFTESVEHSCKCEG